MPAVLWILLSIYRNILQKGFGVYNGIKKFLKTNILLFYFLM